jgi:hypothetical protein
VVPAHLPRADVDAVIDGGLESYGDSAITDPQELRAELPRVRQDGYALNRNQALPDVCAISMPDSRYDAGKLEQWGRMVADTAAEIAPGAWSESERGRLRSTEHLLGCDLESGKQRARLHVAVTALDVLRPAGGGPSASPG